ncbi:25S rRNA (uracil2634-N3)-methyltransferase [Aspergillus lucknowensis]|uniref:25S rRNA (uridine-N(3))-methyltransferase BMT5-like domain-containing protein n=1 Tax=Aspergillus lucknowensis TaxID=176173 RepID=A0ABR4LP45_9EURO
MTKPKRARVQKQHALPHVKPSHGRGKGHRKMSSFAKLSTKNNYNRNNATTGGGNTTAHTRKNEKHQQKQHTRPIVPFRRRDRILLVGEGDFSFARSLATYHRCKTLLATCYDSKETLYSKHPQAEKNIADILASSASSSSSSKPERDEQQQQHSNSPIVLFSVDAKKLGTPAGGGRDIRVGFPRNIKKRPAWVKGDRVMETNQGGPWDMICFNFPHVGGLSTDVNRQVRANQELLVTFFKACLPLLSGKPEEGDHVGEESGDGWDSGMDGSDEDGSDAEGRDDDDDVRAKDERRTAAGQVLVTLFEGAPYTLWNIRDLARHAGLKVVTSFRFPWACYRGYSHARTLGEVEGKDGARGGWRGEDREARMYLFEAKTDDHTSSLGLASEKRRKRPVQEDDSDSEPDL